MTTKRTGQIESQLGWPEIGFILEGLAFADRPLQRATEGVTQEFSLGPRGAWMVLIIARGGLYPSDLTDIFQVGRSLVTSELNRLVEAGLIVYRRDDADGRRIELALTALGEKINRRVKASLSKLVQHQLREYSRDEILLCARMLRDFRRTSELVNTERYEAWSDAQLSVLAEERADHLMPRRRAAASSKKPRS